VSSGVADEEALFEDLAEVSGFSIAGSLGGVLGLFGDSTADSGLSVAGEEVGSLGEA
jgi:hypothetical protein